MFIYNRRRAHRDVIEIYSGNTRLLEDIKEIALKLSYICWGPKKKFRYGKLDSFRIYISTNSAIQFYRDIKQVTKAYPTCGLAQKQKLLETIIKRKERKINKTADGVAKNKINKMLIKHAMTVSEIAEKLSIGHTSMREHLQRLNQLGIVERIGKKGKHADLWSKVR